MPEKSTWITPTTIGFTVVSATFALFLFLIIACYLKVTVCTRGFRGHYSPEKHESKEAKRASFIVNKMTEAMSFPDPERLI